MAAPIGNKFWLKRSKHGRNTIIKDAKTLEEAANEYFQQCIDNPVIQIDYKGGRNGVERVEIPHPKVFQKGEFARFCGVSEWRLIEDLKEKGEDFSQIITYIEGIIRDQKFTYATVGMFNSNIVARDLGLSDKKEVTNKVPPLFPDVDHKD